MHAETRMLKRWYRRSFEGAVMSYKAYLRSLARNWNMHARGAMARKGMK